MNAVTIQTKFDVATMTCMISIDAYARSFLDLPGPENEYIVPRSEGLPGSPK